MNYEKLIQPCEKFVNVSQIVISILWIVCMIFLDIIQFSLGDIWSHAAYRPIVHEKKYLMDFKDICFKLPSSCFSDRPNHNSFEVEKIWLHKTAVWVKPCLNNQSEEPSALNFSLQ